MFIYIREQGCGAMGGGEEGGGKSLSTGSVTIQSLDAIMSRSYHLHLSCCQSNCILINIGSVHTGPHVTVSQTHNLCGNIYGEPNTTWAVSCRGTSRQTTPVQVLGVLPPVIPTVTIGKKAGQRSILRPRIPPPPPPADIQGPVITSTNAVCTQTPEAVVLAWGTGDPPALFQTHGVSTIFIINLLFPGPPTVNFPTPSPLKFEQL